MSGVLFENFAHGPVCCLVYRFSDHAFGHGFGAFLNRFYVAQEPGQAVQKTPCPAHNTTSLKNHGAHIHTSLVEKNFVKTLVAHVVDSE